jgi:serine/threonine protein kinase
MRCMRADACRHRLAWPRLDITGQADESIEGGLELIRNSVVQPCPTLDSKKGFALKCIYRDGTKTFTYFAASKTERDEWCKHLRKHAVHHNLENGFEVTKKVLGTGAYATVYMAKDKLTGEAVAVKVIDRTRLNEEERKLLAEEAWISQELKHPYCVKTSEFIENRTSYVLVMEFVAGGELFERLLYHKYPEREVQSIMRQILQAVSFMHARNIVHFDLKPENFLLTLETPMTLKIGSPSVTLSCSLRPSLSVSLRFPLSLSLSPSARARFSLLSPPPPLHFTRAKSVAHNWVSILLWSPLPFRDTCVCVCVCVCARARMRACACACGRLGVGRGGNGWERLSRTHRTADFGVAMDISRDSELKRCFKSKGMLRCSPGYGAPEIVHMQVALPPLG